MAPDGIDGRLAQLIERYVSRCAPELLDAYGLTLTSVEAHKGELPSYSLAGIVGFVGHVNGTLLVGADPPMVVRSHPLRAKQPEMSERMQLDWIGELANQLMGRVKGRLAEHDVDVRFSPPISLAGTRMRHVATPGRTHRSRFASPDGDELSVWVDAEVRSSIVLPDRFFEDLPEVAGIEGELILL